MFLSKNIARWAVEIDSKHYYNHKQYTNRQNITFEQVAYLQHTL